MSTSPPPSPTGTPPPSPFPSPLNQNPPSQTPLQSFITSTITATSPPLRHLASHSTLNSLRSPSSIHSGRTRTSTRFRPLSATFEEQRHAPKSGFSITRNTKIFDPARGAATVAENGRDGNEDGENEVNRSKGGMGIGGKGKRESGMNFASSGLGSADDERFENLSSQSQEQISYPTLIRNVKKDGKLDDKSATEKAGKKNNAEKEVGDDDENIYPGPLGLVLLVIGLCLSVFLISLDRTIITTAIPYITSEFSSTSDIGWYGSSYLLTASAFQPLYGRVFMLFNMKWTYLAALTMFELGSLICGVAPNSMTLIIGRALAGLGSAGILTGSFVVVSHAVPLHKRPILTAVVGLMFGLGATVGPLLGGVFTDLVTWRWCFYFNLPVGGATALSMILFFHPPKKHAMMGKSFIYRVMELDLVGNFLILGGTVMLILALQLTEEQVAWGNAEVVGLLVGSGVTFIIFCVWQWWKADGALMPPRILKQRSVAASCAAAFFIYSAILIHSYFLPIYFQAIKGDSAVRSGVNMIPYVIANALFSLLAGIFVSKNGYFTAPAIVGCAIGTIGAGLLSTIGLRTSSSMWIGYEILASVGIGMAIQQGFTAIQIVLPLDEVAIGTAAVVAFQSLGGAIFVSVGNTILQNSLLSAAGNDMLPRVDVQSVIRAGASQFRDLVTEEQLPILLEVYSGALKKVFIAAIPMMGLAFVSCLFLEWRSVKDKKSLKDEEALKKVQERKETEDMILEAHRRRV